MEFSRRLTNNSFDLLVCATHLSITNSSPISAWHVYWRRFYLGSTFVYFAHQ